MTNTYFLTTITPTKTKVNHSAPPAVLLMSTTYILHKTKTFWFFYFFPVVVVQPLSHVQLCNPMDCCMWGFPVLHYLLSLFKFMSIELVMLSNNLILCYSLLLLPSIFLSIRDFSSEYGICIRWPIIGASGSVSVLLSYPQSIYKQTLLA